MKTPLFTDDDISLNKQRPIHKAVKETVRALNEKHDAAVSELRTQLANVERENARITRCFEAERGRYQRAYERLKIYAEKLMVAEGMANEGHIALREAEALRKGEG